MEKIWIKNYQEGVPHEINPDAFQSIAHFFQHYCERYSNRDAYSNLGHAITYSELEEYSKNFAAYLQQELGLKKGARVAIMMPNTLQFPVAMFGVLRAGMIVINVNPLYTPHELIHQLNDSGADTILVLANFAHTVAESLPHTLVRHVIVTELGDLLPFPKSSIVNLVVKHIKKMVPKCSIKKAIAFKDVMRVGKNHVLDAVHITGDDIAFLQYTGGTTGLSKGAVLTHRNMIANIEQIGAWMSPVIDDGDEIIITALPLYHIFSLTANAFFFMKFGALNVLITNPKDIPAFVKEMKKFRFTAITGVNTLFNALVHNDEFAKLDFSSLKVALGGGMAVQEAVAIKWKEVTGKTLREGYGLTEASPVVCLNPGNQKEFNGSIGLPISSTEISIRDEQGNEVPIGESGELCVRGPQVMREYWNQPEETDKVLSSDGWLSTGDIAKVNEDGYTYIVERKKDMILVSGFNVYPNEVENVIAKHPGVLEVAVVGVPNNATGEIVMAYIVKNDQSLDKDTIREHCREELTAYKIPKTH